MYFRKKISKITLVYKLEVYKEPKDYLNFSPHGNYRHNRPLHQKYLMDWNLCLPTRVSITIWNILKGIPRPELLLRNMNIELKNASKLNILSCPGESFIYVRIKASKERQEDSWWGPRHQADERDLWGGS